MAKARNDRGIDYIEFLVGDIPRTRNFYGEAFGWSFKDYGPSYCEFNDRRMTGGFALANESSQGRGSSPLVILYSKDLAATQQRIERAGGTIVKPVYSFPGGRRFHFADPDGHELSVWTDK